MRIAYVGNFEPEWSTENDVRIALESLGHHVLPLQENQVSPTVLRNSAIHADVLWWTGTWDDAQPLIESLETLTMLAREGIPSVTQHLDTFWPTKRSGRQWWRHPQWFTSHVFTADGDHQPEWHTFGCLQHQWLPPGVRHTVTEEPGTYREEFACDVAFVGADGEATPYHPEWPYRRKLVRALRVMCDRRGWSFKNPGGTQEKVGREQMADFYASARVTIGDSLCTKRDMSHYWSDRVYEATGRQGMLIMPFIRALDTQFNGALPMYAWDDFGQLEKLIAHFLENDDDNQAVREACWEVTRKHHTYRNRAQTIINELEKIG